MKTYSFILAVFATAITSCREQKTSTDGKSHTDPAGQSTSVTSQQERIRRGEYLVTTMGCHDCHTPKVMTEFGPAPDTSKLLAGHDGRMPLPPFDTAFSRQGAWVMMSGSVTAFAGPWGMSFAANLTPDETGIGNWTLDNFKTAIKKGKYKGIEASRPLLPPMPWQNLVNISDEDAGAIFDYLKSIKPVNNRVPNAILAQH